MATAAIDHATFARDSVDLARAIELAEAEVHAALFKQRSGAGTAADTTAAKAHLASLREQLADNEATWSGAVVAEREQMAADARARHKTLVADIDTELSARRECVTRALAGVDALIAAVREYREIDARILQQAHGVNTLSGDRASRAREGVAMALGDVAAAAAMGRLSEAHLRVGAGSSFSGAEAINREDQMAEHLRVRIAAFDPSETRG